MNTKAKQGKLYMGEPGWENAYAVVDGMVEGLRMDEHELIWLLA
jgi:hypothetical protein